MAKVRVYELAKQLGMESKDLLKKLSDMGEFVRSASSTLESPVVRRVTEAVKGSADGAEQAADNATTPQPGAPKVKTSTQPRTADAVASQPAGSKRPSAATAGGATAKPSGVPRPSAIPSQGAGSTGATKSPSPTPKTAQIASAKPGPAADRSRRSDADAKRGGADANRPTPASVRPAAPRPGNNPFATAQGMGQKRRGSKFDSRGQDRAGAREDRGADRSGRGRSGGPVNSVPGMPRPNPAMMPKHQSRHLSESAVAGSGSQSSRYGGRGGRGSGRNSQSGSGSFPPSVPNQRGGAPMGGGRGGRGGRGGSGTQGAFGRGSTKRKGKSKKQRNQESEVMIAPLVGGVRIKSGEGQTIRLRRGASLADLAEKIGVDAAELVKILFNMGEMVTATQSVADETLEILGAELNYKLEVVSPEDEDRELLESFDLEFGQDAGDESDLESRPPVVTVMGHVDHGKTKLLDAFRHSNVVEKEAGGITQAIGAYQVRTEVDGQKRRITFIDTPGHEAFTAMRARGAKATDIAVLVVAADDGVMPQTIEALNHAKAADVPIVVAVNKIDKPEANPTKVRGQLSEYGLVPEEYGGDTMFVDVSAKQEQGLDQLLEAVVLTSDAALDLRANPNMDAQGVTIEAHLDQGRGPVATVLIQRGTLRKGDSIVAGSAHGRVRAMINDHGDTIDEAPPSMPVQVLGLTSVPGAGDNFMVVEDDRMARQIADKREARMRAAAQARTSQRKTLDDLVELLQKGEQTQLNLILKGDSAGSVEALEASLAKIDVGEEVVLNVIDRGVGGITETNVVLAEASNAVIIGFNVRAQGKAKQLADEKNIDIRYYSIIYQAIEEIEAAMRGMLKPIYEEKTLGEAEIRQVFKSSKIGNIAGCLVMSGIIRRNAKARLLRDGVVVSETTIASLRREKDDVTEVREGYECGLTLANYKDIRAGDVVEVYEMVEKPRD